MRRLSSVVLDFGLMCTAESNPDRLEAHRKPRPPCISWQRLFFGRSMRLRAGVPPTEIHERVPDIHHRLAEPEIHSGVAPHKVLSAHGSMQAIQKPVARLVNRVHERC